MSAAYVRDPQRPVSIPDELESFFHVLLHHSVRYMRHSFHNNATSFIINYFDTFQQFDNEATRCSFAKVHAVTYGDISVDEKPLVFETDLKDPVTEHPLNALLRDWLQLYKARYSLLKQQRNELRASKAAANRPANDTTTNVQASEDSDDELFDADYPKAPSKQKSQRPVGNAVASKAADAETMAKAAKLEAHSETIDIFDAHLEKLRWPKNDVVGDQLQDYNPKKHFAAAKSVMMTNLATGRVSTSSKRVKHDHNDAVASGSEPAPAPTSQPTGPQNSRRRKRGANDLPGAWS